MWYMIVWLAMVRRLLIISALFFSIGNFCSAQRFGVKAVYSYEVGASEKVKAMPEGEIKNAVLEQLRAKGHDFELYYSDGYYGFARKDVALQDGTACLDGDGAVYIYTRGG